MSLLGVVFDSPVLHHVGNNNLLEARGILLLCTESDMGLHFDVVAMHNIYKYVEIVQAHVKTKKINTRKHLSRLFLRGPAFITRPRLTRRI